MPQVRKRGKDRKTGESQEPVVHFKEWTTSSARNGEKSRKPGGSHKPVAHFEEWTTS